MEDQFQSQDTIVIYRPFQRTAHGVIPAPGLPEITLRRSGEGLSYAQVGQNPGLFVVGLSTNEAPVLGPWQGVADAQNFTSLAVPTLPLDLTGSHAYSTDQGQVPMPWPSGVIPSPLPLDSGGQPTQPFGPMTNSWELSHPPGMTAYGETLPSFMGGAPPRFSEFQAAPQWTEPRGRDEPVLGGMYISDFELKHLHGHLEAHARLILWLRSIPPAS